MERDDDHRVLVLMPNSKDAERTRHLLGTAGLAPTICKDLLQLSLEIRRGAALALLTEEALESDTDCHLATVLAQQPPWSDFPLIVIAKDRPVSRDPYELMNRTLIERPIRMRSLMSVIHASLRSRRHQYDVRDHIRERERLEIELREASRKKDDFIAILAHELRNPLAPLRNGLQILQLANQDALVTAQAREMMERQLSHMVRLIDDLLDISRITRNKLELRKERILISDVVNAAVETARPVIDAAQLDLSVSVPAQPIYLYADHVRLAQVFANLLSNSAKFTAVGGHIWISVQCHPSEVIASVKDTGIGIPDESLDHIFDMFSQVERAKERTHGGLGIGLALVRGLVEAHGGWVRAESAGLGHGATFTVSLPLDPTQQSAQPSERNGRRALPLTTRILVADDNADSAESLRMVLHYMGHEVHVAHDGAEAVELAEQLRPQLILMDIGMPRLNGLEATTAIRKRCWGRDVVIVALTGWGQARDRCRSQQAGCNEHLVKPLDRCQLDRVLELLPTSLAREPHEPMPQPDRN